MMMMMMMMMMMTHKITTIAGKRSSVTKRKFKHLKYLNDNDEFCDISSFKKSQLK